MEATKRPFDLPLRIGSKHPCRIIDAGGILIASTCEALDEGSEWENQKEAARLIITACNHFDEMVEVLKEAESHLDEELRDPRSTAVHPIGYCPVLDRVRALLAKIKEG